MASGENKGGMLNAMRASADSALKRLAPKKAPQHAPASETEQDRPFFSDPTTALFPSGAAAEDESGHALPLAMQLEQSAQAMARRKEDLREPTWRLSSRIEDRREGEITLMAQGLRVIIGLFWLGVAGWLHLGILNARADGLGVVAGAIPFADAAALFRAFFTVAAVGLAVPFGVAALTHLFGNSNNDRIKREAEALGAKMAEAADEFDETLTGLRAAMDKRGHPADAIDDLSRAHLTALEAHDFFREISFLSGDETDRAQRMFKGFLARAGGVGGGGIMGLAVAFITGLLAGGIMMHVAYAPEPEPVADVKAVVAVTSYPWAVQFILAGGLIYALVGGLLSLFTGPLTEGVAAKARAEALTALRSGFASKSALHPADITRRIKDAVDVFRARVGGRSTTSSTTNHTNADFAGDDAEPEWRRRDSSVKFVETGFAGAPREWRTDAYAKKFEAPEAGKTGSKRGSKTP
ncbi:hypothetical protein PUV54_08760 [Hyphococcus flavus]|uniref:Uncharacterized protein n=1 Tax=Hyphococcus flavus TaxID=1866326 RepID=A0AAE9ZCI6_9PROT|nr:hypothetical protein [Hyphococcus flavus]WDI30048.1 hypothetical protein PUV54_08760 [Hyphococcus flavus]